MEASVTPKARPFLRLLLLALAAAGTLAGPTAAETIARVSGAASLPSREAVLLHKLGARAAEIDRTLDGLLGLSIKDLKTGATLDLRESETFPTASSIKAAVLYEVYRQAEEGRLDLREVTRPPGARVGGGGALQLLSDQVSLTWRDLAALMFAFSDNEATNVLVRRVGLPAVNSRLDSLGLPGTRLRRLMMDLDAARWGGENVSTPSELRRLMETLHAGTGLSPDRARDLRVVAALPKDSPFRGPVREGVTVLDKEGSLEGVRCVGAVVELSGRPYSAAIMTSFLAKDADGEEAIRALSAAVFETFDRLARSSELGRVVND